MFSLLRQAAKPALNRCIPSIQTRLISTTISTSLPSTSTSTTPTPTHSTPPIQSTTRSTTGRTKVKAIKRTHFLITLLRSPLHLPASIQATCTSLGLLSRLQTTLVPISSINAGYILRIKELIAVRLVGMEEFNKVRSEAWREREGEGKRGSGFREANHVGGVSRIGSERCRGEERGFKIVKR